MTSLPEVPPGALVLLVGAPASGKSTYAASLVAAGVVAASDVLSADEMRLALAGSADDLGVDRQMWVALRRALVERLAAGRTTVVDATHLWPARRARHLRVARTYGRPVVAVVLDVPVDVLLARNAARSRVVPAAAVVSMARQAALVTDDLLRAEGIDAVHRVVLP